MTDERTPLLPPGSPTSSAEECTVVPATPGEADDGHTISKTDFRWLMGASGSRLQALSRGQTDDPLFRSQSAYG